MNKSKIEEAVAILTKALKEPPAPEPQVTVTLMMTARQRSILREIGRTNITVPRVVANYSIHADEADVRKVLDIICLTLGDY